MDTNCVPKAVQIVTVEKENGKSKLVFKNDILKEILSDEAYWKKPVVVVSVVGDYRTGKSFFLNFLILYFEKRGIEWLNNGDPIPKHFSWSGQCDGHTKGIWMYSKPFLVNLPTGEEAVLLLMDTQGNFDVDDDESSRDISTKIFALSCFLSSIQIFNFKNLIKASDLENFKLFANYGKMCSSSHQSENPIKFQKLCFLIRDWSSPTNFPFGVDGGRQYMESRKSVKKCACDFFENVCCMLLPSPGRKICDGECQQIVIDSTCNESDDDSLFFNHLRQFIENSFSSDQLVALKIFGFTISVEKFVDFFSDHFQKIFINDQFKIESVDHLYKLASYEKALESAIDYYHKEMTSFIETTCTTFNDKTKFKQSLKSKHTEVSAETKQQFLKSDRMQDEELENKFIEKMNKTIEKQYKTEFKIMICLIEKKEKLRSMYKKYKQELRDREKDLEEIKKKKDKSDNSNYKKELNELREKLRNVIENVEKLKADIVCNKRVEKLWSAGSTVMSLAGTVAIGTAVGYAGAKFLGGAMLLTEDSIKIVTNVAGKKVSKVLTEKSGQAVVHKLGSLVDKAGTDATVKITKKVVETAATNASQTVAQNALAATAAKAGGSVFSLAKLKSFFQNDFSHLQTKVSELITNASALRKTAEELLNNLNKESN